MPAPVIATSAHPSPAGASADSPTPAGPSLEPPPPAPWWLRALRAVGVSAICLIIGLLVLVFVYGTTIDEQGDLSDRLVALFIVDLLVGLAAALAVGPMRRAGAANLILVAALAVSGMSVAAAAVALARLGERRARLLDAAAIILAVGGSVVSSLLFRWAEGSSSGTLPWEMLLTCAFAAAALLWGRARGTRAALIASLRAQASTARRERDALEREHRALIAQAQAEQRAAIARDMHDSLSHHLSLIAMHAGALEYRRDLPEAQRQEAASIIRRGAQAANTELREVLGALRADGMPLPTAADLVTMLEDARAAGQEVTLLWSDAPAEDPAAGEEPFTPQMLDGMSRAGVVTLVRIARELLTNARKHAPGTRLDLRLHRAGEQLVLRASNPVPREAPAAGARLGLVGVRERIVLLGGSLHIEDGTAGRFAVEARLPWRD
ncbi:sensor histidine kinase [Brachybacterium phenoliresistens]|uniref:sensor histidine kinase n=1 Tax=Brachybacterium phenoliresistens TaxID=396014 RepID=UPI0031E049DB